MTVSAHAGPLIYNGNGSTKAFSYTWKAIDENDLLVILVDVGGVETMQTIDTHYTVSGVGESDGGTVTMVDAPETGEKLIIAKGISMVQETDYEDYDPFPADSHEDALDNLTLMCQELYDMLMRVPMFSVSSEVENIPISAPEAGTYLAWNNDADAIINVSGVSAVEFVVSTWAETLLDDASAGEARVTLDVYSRAEIDVISDDLADTQEMIAKENMILNGDFRIAQRGTSFTAATIPANNDDTYLIDRWNLLSDGADVVDVAQESSPANLPDGFWSGCKFTVVTANKKFGILQLLENKDIGAFRNKAVSLSFRAYVESTSGPGNPPAIPYLRVGIMNWIGTADSPTSDVVSAWGVPGVNPTLVTNWAFENTPGDLVMVADAWTQFNAENIVIDNSPGSTSNLGIFIWADTPSTAGGYIMRITGVKLEINPVATPWKHRHQTLELALCQRYYERWGGVDSYFPKLMGYNAAGQWSVCPISFLTTKRVSPTITRRGTWLVNNCGQPVFDYPTPNGIQMNAQVTALGAFQAYPNSADDIVEIDSEL